MCHIYSTLWMDVWRRESVCLAMCVCVYVCWMSEQVLLVNTLKDIICLLLLYVSWYKFCLLLQICFSRFCLHQKHIVCLCQRVFFLQKKGLVVQFTVYTHSGSGIFTETNICMYIESLFFFCLIFFFTSVPFVGALCFSFNFYYS